MTSKVGGNSLSVVRPGRRLSQTVEYHARKEFGVEWPNGGSKMEKVCGIVWTQNGGEICRSGCEMGIEITMTQNACGMVRFLTKEAHVQQQSTRIVWNGGFISNSINIKVCGVT